MFLNVCIRMYVLEKLKIKINDVSISLRSQKKCGKLNLKNIVYRKKYKEQK